MTGLSMGLVSAGLGAGLDRAWTATADARTARAADISKALAIQQQANKDAQLAALAIQQRDLDAAHDKAAAIEEIKAQLPSRTDPSISMSFERLGHRRPWLSSLRKSVGFFECYTKGVAYRGAAEIIDAHGTLVLCGHEFVHQQNDVTALSVTFFLSATSAVKLPVRMMFVDRRNDVAFATFTDPRAVRDHGLQPVQWNGAERQQAVSGDEVVFVGFPEGIARIHATSGDVHALRRVNTIDGDGSVMSHACKIETGGVTFSGMSGGGAFRNGAFAGIVNFSSPAGDAPYTYFTPAQAIQAAYAGLFPERAKSTGLSMADLTPISSRLPAECAFDRRGFLAIASR